MKINNLPLLKISFTISLLGIFLLLFLINILQPKQTLIQDLTEKYLNKQIKIQGQITNIKNFKQYNFILLTIKDSTGEIDVIINNPQINLTKTQNLSIIGKPIQYKDILQIQAEKIVI